jgi:GTP pyrophosphokinase
VLELLAFDRAGLLLDASKVVSEHRINIISSSSAVTSASVARLVFVIELADIAHLDSLIASLRAIDGVFDVFRQTPGQHKAPASPPRS